MPLRAAALRRAAPARLRRAAPRPQDVQPAAQHKGRAQALRLWARARGAAFRRPHASRRHALVPRAGAPLWLAALRRARRPVGRRLHRRRAAAAPAAHARPDRAAAAQADGRAARRAVRPHLARHERVAPLPLARPRAARPALQRARTHIRAAPADRDDAAAARRPADVRPDAAARRRRRRRPRLVPRVAAASLSRGARCGAAPRRAGSARAGGHEAASR
mmetsp:Transcript_37370/g.120746  ORF Transcript_37370/g.120746 Transcript_37370/m.120746 type:complete len:220 (+) Transcript_37370:602-1261(+)